MKKTISATIDIDLVKWIESKTRDTLDYRNKSHLIEKAIQLMKDSLDGKKR